MSKISIKLAGFKEENIHLCTSILEEAKIKTGDYALITKTYSLEIEERLKCIDIILEDEVILNPYDTAKINKDFIICLAQDSFEEFKNNIKEDGIIIIDPNFVKFSKSDINKWKIFQIPIVSISKENIKEEKAQLALALAITNFMTKENIENEILKETMLSKISDELKKTYQEAFDLGYEYAQNILKSNLY